MGYAVELYFDVESEKRTTISLKLVEVHQAFHRQLAEIGVRSKGYYEPGVWVPHCTVATDLTPDKISKAIDVCRNSTAFGPIQLSAIGLVSF